MSARLFAVLSLTAAAVFVPGGTAHAAPPTTGPAGPKCGYVGSLDPALDAAPRATIGALFAGPVIATVPGAFADGTLTCSLRINAPLHATLLAEAWRESVETEDGIAFMDPKPVAFVVPPSSDVYLCTKFRYSTGETFYWNAAAAAWTTSNAVPCAEVAVVGTGDPTVRETRTAPCPVIALLPFGFDSAVGNLYGCFGNAPYDDFGVAYVAVPPL